MDTLIKKPFLKSRVNDQNVIGWHNFELVMNYMVHTVLKGNNEFSTKDLLTLAKYTVCMSFDHHCKQLNNCTKELFNSCIEMALYQDNETAIVEFAQELYSKHTRDDLQNIIVNLFLPLKGPVTRKMYTYLTFKLYNLFLGETNNVNSFPVNNDIW